MLQEERLDNGWQDQPFAARGDAESEAKERERWRHGFDVALDVPFFVELDEASLDSRTAAADAIGNVLLGLPADLIVDRFGRIAGDAVAGGGEHDSISNW